MKRDVTRRRLLRVLAGGAALLASPLRVFAKDEKKLPLTPADGEGPFYRRGAPARTDLRVKGAKGPPLTLRGVVRLQDGRPLKDITLDLWHADAKGRYDMRTPAFRYRARVKTDAKGRYALTTDWPGVYMQGRFWRDRHIHVKLAGPWAWRLTTQVYLDLKKARGQRRLQAVPVTWSGEGKARKGTATWNPVLLFRNSKKV